MQSDLNLLYGVMALQNAFINQDQLIDALNAWTLDKRKSIGTLLVERRYISTEALAELDKNVERKLKQFDNDAAKALPSVNATQTLCHHLDTINDEDVVRSVAHLENEAPLVTVAPTEPGTASTAGTRFDMLRPLAKGGLGQVSVAMDKELHREVALKEILPRWADQTVYRDRFTLEAEVTGGLEHPGIVPVYGLGQAADGRPYYAMRLIKGNSLREALKKFHGMGASSNQYVLEIHKLLGRFIAMCNTLHYAHSRGVLHRDLKPDNIMLGDYGETLIVDWGLAKLDDLVAKSAIGDTTILLRPPASKRLPVERKGTTYGTPAYMAPEQAVGDLGQIGIRTDVYGMGAILYHLLSGQQPITSRDTAVALRAAERGEFPKPREIAKGIPKPLEAICLKAMALAPNDRYETAADLADDVQRWLADEPVTAYRENIAERLARWFRRHRSAVISLLVITALSLAAAFFVNQARNRTKAALERETAAKQEAVANFGLARDAVNKWYSGLAAEFDGYESFKPYREKLLRSAVQDYRVLAERQSQDQDIELERARTLLRLAEFEFDLNELDQAQTDYQGASDLLAALAQQPRQPPAVLDQATAQRGLGKVAVKRNELRQADKLFRSAVELLTRAIPGKSANDQALYRKSLAECLADRGQALILLGEIGEAETVLRNALKSFNEGQTLVVSDLDLHNVCHIKSRLAMALAVAGKFKESTNFCAEASEKQKELTAKHPGNVAYAVALIETREILADVQRRQGQLKESLDTLAEYYPSLQTAKLETPSLLEAKARVASRIGAQLYRIGDPANARTFYQTAATDYADLAATFANERYAELAAIVRSGLGRVLCDLGVMDEALQDSQDAHSFFEKNYESAIAAAPLTVKRSYALVKNHLALVNQQQANNAEAGKLFQRAIDLLAEARTQLPDAQDDYAQVTMNYARLQTALGQVEVATQLRKQAVGAWDKLLATSDSPEFLYYFVTNVALDANFEKSVYEKALGRAEQAVKLVPENTDYLAALGAVRFRLEQYEQSRKVLRQAEARRGRALVWEKYFEAMCSLKLNEQEDAKQKLKDADDLFNGLSPGNASHQVLKQEAEGLIEKNQP